MASITRTSDASVDASSAKDAILTTYPALTDIADACTPVYLNTSRQWVRTNGTAATAPAICWGFTVEPGIKAGQPCTVATTPIRMMYNSAGGLTQGDLLYVDTVVGGLNNAATTGGTKAVARVYDASRGLIQSLATGLMQ